MATDSYGQTIVIPALADAPNISTVGSSIDALVGRSVMRFASASARAATLAAPVEGMTAWLADVDQLTVYDGSAWVVLGRALTRTFVEDTTNRTVTSTTYVNGSGLLSAQIVGPKSGAVEVEFKTRCDNSGGSTVLSSFTASGTVTGTIYSPNDAAATVWANMLSVGPLTITQEISCAVGETVTVALQHRTVANTGNLRYRSLRLRQL
ncbi:hypothetical protein ABZX85_23440 [Streptomyces sp. NPDC004539]|uniref:hypothetical protein n=1 Tax=Streptomyces sp. NPDC004539 TaxID=3154280 RepID=UPI0033A8E053